MERRTFHLYTYLQNFRTNYAATTEGIPTRSGSARAVVLGWRGLLDKSQFGPDAIAIAHRHVNDQDLVFISGVLDAQSQRLQFVSLSLQRHLLTRSSHTRTDPHGMTPPIPCKVGSKPWWDPGELVFA